MHCLSCDYNLKGASNGRCPECGRIFDAADPRTFQPMSRGLTGRLIVVFGDSLGAITVFLLGVLIIVRFWWP